MKAVGSAKTEAQRARLEELSETAHELEYHVLPHIVEKVTKGN